MGEKTKLPSDLLVTVSIRFPLASFRVKLNSPARSARPFNILVPLSAAFTKVLALDAVVFERTNAVEVFAGILHQGGEGKSVLGILRLGEKIGIDHVGFVIMAVDIFIVAVVELEFFSFYI